MNATHDPRLRSFVDVPPESHFPIQNLPFGVFSNIGQGPARVGIAIGDQVLDLSILEDRGFFREATDCAFVFNQPALNDFLALGPSAWTAVRGIVSHLLNAEIHPARRPHVARGGVDSAG